MPKTEPKQIPDHAKRLIEFRKKVMKKTQKEFAEEFETTQATIYKWENGLYNIPIELPAALHRKYGMRYSWWHDGEGSVTDVATKKEMVTDINKMNLAYDHLLKEMSRMRVDFNKLYAEFHAFKNGVKQ